MVQCLVPDLAGQQKALNIAGKYPDLSADDKAAAAKTAGMFSRINTMLSIPMLLAWWAPLHFFDLSAAFGSLTEDVLRRHDQDRYCAALFAPADARPHLFALYALNYEVARVAETVREPMIADIRLAWWRETVEGARSGKPRDHDVARALAATLATVDLPAECSRG